MTALCCLVNYKEKLNQSNNYVKILSDTLSTKYYLLQFKIFYRNTRESKGRYIKRIEKYAIVIYTVCYKSLLSLDTEYQLLKYQKDVELINAEKTVVINLMYSIHCVYLI